MATATEYLKQIRQQVGKTQKDMADHLGYSVSYYGMLETGVKPITRKVIKKLIEKCPGIEINTNYFFT